MAKLDADKKQELVQLIAERKTQLAIVKHFKDKHGLIVHEGQIQQYKKSPKWIPVIREKREAWDKELSSEYLASKRNRLEALEKARISAMEGGFTGTDKESGKQIFKNSPAAAVAAIRQAQEEIEGTKIRHEVGIEAGLAELLLEINGATRGLPKKVGSSSLCVPTDESGDIST